MVGKLKHINWDSQFDSAHCDRKTERSRSLLWIIIIFLLFVSSLSSAQKTDAFARVSVSPREGVVRQPYKVTISVYSSTWFAKPLQFANLRIDNAFIIPFTRTVSGINYLNNKKYATLTFYYLVFPYNTGNLEIPELEISASIPPEGDYKGQPVTIRTKKQAIKVKPVPLSEDEQVWMVAKNIRINESWSKPLNNLKVGDVIEREITMSASGTLPSLIQPLKIEKADLLSIYPKEPELKDTRTPQDVNGERTEKYSYLFEEEGEVIISEEEVLWWNPQTKRVYKRTIPEQKLSIAANPDLAMMESLKDSLMAMNATTIIEKEEESIPWEDIGVFFILLGLTIYFSRKALVLIVQNRKEKHEAYLQSEDFYFRQVQNVLQTNSKQQFLNSLYSWFDKARIPGQSAAIYDYLNEKDRNLLESVIQKNDALNLSSDNEKNLSAVVKKLRTQILQVESGKTISSKLNPN